MTTTIFHEPAHGHRETCQQEASDPDAPRIVTNLGTLLDHFTRLAAHDAATTSALAVVFSYRNGLGARQAAHGLTAEQIAALTGIDAVLGRHAGPTIIPDLKQDSRFDLSAAPFTSLQNGFVTHLNLLSPGGERAGFLCVLDPAPRPGLTEAQADSLRHIGDMIVADRKREQRHLHLMHVADRALRVDRMLRVVSEEATSTDALNTLLEELTAFHGASSGSLWQMATPDAPLAEINRFQPPDGAEEVADTLARTTLLRDTMAEAIRRNRPQSTSQARPDSPDPNGSADSPARPFGCVCAPIWVHRQRFGISLAFTSGDANLDLVMADVASLAEAVRPVLLRKAGEERIRFAAHHDDLTKLPNRLMFQERLHRAFASARSGGQAFALMALDLDGFKLVNDTRGHDMGDQLLVSVAERLRDSLRDTDTVARIGGDEFAVIQQYSGDPASAVALAERLLATMAAPFDLSGRPSVVGLSIGIALFPEHGDTPDVLLRHADVALYRAKSAGRNTWRLHSSDVQQAGRDRFPGEQDLRDAVDGNKLTLAFQPICESDGLRIVGFESLLRWHDPVMGPVEPDRFIPLAESSGLIHLLGQRTLEAACTEAMTWNQPARLSVNLSPSQFCQRDLAGQIARVLDQTGLPPSRLELEITEGLPLEHTDLVLGTFRALQQQGIRIMTDDFGTAHANLDSLRRFPFDGVKIDKSFIWQLTDDRNSLAFVEAILTLCERLDLIAVAEGVETERQLRIVRDLGCRFVQGYLTGRPAEAARTRSLLINPGRAQSLTPADCAAM